MLPPQILTTAGNKHQKCKIKDTNNIFSCFGLQAEAFNLYLAMNLLFGYIISFLWHWLQLLIHI